MNTPAATHRNHSDPGKGLPGHRFLYTYANGWIYEMYVKNSTTIDYRIHTGHVGGRWVRDQHVDLVEIAPQVYKLSWTEPTGTCVVVNVMPADRRLHGTIFFPEWIRQDGAKTVLYQNEHLDQMQQYRDQGPTYPIYVVPEFAEIQLYEYIGENDDTVISVAPSKLPATFLEKRN
ncbi:phenolic acid decarboxylase [Mycolicibacter arupensis]|uniref:phenolic acid decarboxylase n=1 Tax=Mycolicibacter arupensis TaxID=342002 RepID=UPI003B3A6A35